MTARTDLTTRLTGRKGVRFGCVCVLVGLFLLVTTPVTATAGTGESTDSGSSLPAKPAFIVDLYADGSARVTLVTTLDLSTGSEREAFEALRANETAREQRTDRFATRMQAIANRAEKDIGRSMAIRNPAMTFTTENDTGIVALSVMWDGLAAQESGRLVLREPFASGFYIDRSFRVLGPDGYALGTATPTPTNQQQNSATWSATTQFDRFETVFAPAEGGTSTNAGNGTSGVGTPGFGVGVAVIAVLAAVFLVARRRRM